MNYLDMAQLIRSRFAFAKLRKFAAQQPLWAFLIPQFTALLGITVAGGRACLGPTGSRTKSSNTVWPYSRAGGSLWPLGADLMLWYCPATSHFELYCLPLLDRSTGPRPFLW